MRHLRLESPSGYYHVIQRGMGKQILFEEDEDYEEFLKRLHICRKKYEFKVIAFCLMPNHTHMLIKVETVKTLSKIMQSVGTGYAMYYNCKYAHVGSVFQGRFKSLAITNDEYLLSCVQYIHNNPLRARISKRNKYEWSSYNYYVDERNISNEYVCDMLDKNIILDYFSDIEEFIQFSVSKDDYEEKIREKDIKFINECAIASANLIVREHFGNDYVNCLIVKQLCKRERDPIIRKLKKTGLTSRQIELLTGVNRNIVRKV